MHFFLTFFTLHLVSTYYGARPPVPLDKAQVLAPVEAMYYPRSWKTSKEPGAPLFVQRGCLYRSWLRLP